MTNEKIKQELLKIIHEDLPRKLNNEQKEKIEKIKKEISKSDK